MLMYDGLEDMVAGRDVSTGGWAGFSIVELVVVLAIMGTLLGLAYLPFHTWQLNKGAEAEIRQLSTDINDIRMRAMTTKQRYSITLNSSSYSFQNYNSDDVSKCTGGSPYGKTTNVAYKLKKDAATYYVGTCSDTTTGDTFEIDQRGMLVGTKASIYLDYGGSASLDCLILDTVRVNVGKTDATGAHCNAQ